MKTFWQTFKACGWGAMSATFILQPTLAQAQIQRSFLNPSFESPVFSTSCYIQVDESVIPGWTTSHNTKQGTASCTTTGYNTNGKIIEIWTTGFNGGNGVTSTATNAGNQFAELNAEENASLFQQICLIKDETISYSLLHRGRGSTTVPDQATFSIGSKVFGTFSTTSDGTVTNGPVAGTNATVNSPVSAGNGWVRYSGTVTYTDSTGNTVSTGNQNVGFNAELTGSGNITVGNFLDEVQFAGKPVVEFTASSGGAAEAETNPTTNPPKLRIVGLVPAGGISVPISVSGTAVLGTDFNTTSGTSTFNMTIDAGNYDGSDATSVFTIPFAVINNNIPQGVRTIVFTLQPSSSFFASSTITCGNPPTLISNYDIFDDDFLSGKVWDDADNSANNTFTNINAGSETGTNAGGLLNAILVDANNKVLVTTPVAADGTYTFANVPLNQSNVTIILSTTAGTPGSTAPTPSLPSNWINTSPLTTAPFNTATNISSKDFGIEQLPNTNNVTASSQGNPGGTNKVQVPTLSGTDFEDGNLGTGKTFKIINLPTNGTLYYNSIAVTANQIITNYDPTLLTIDPNDGLITVTFTVAAVDAAGREDPTPATVTMPFVIGGNPQLLLVKRITAINGNSINKYEDDTTSTTKDNDNNPNWPTPLNTNSSLGSTNFSTFLRGVINGGTVKPKDELEYTIYFLSSGNTPITNVNLCDLVPENVTFSPSSFTGNTPTDGGLAAADSGIVLTIGSITKYLTNVADAPDRGQYFPPGIIPPASVKCSVVTNTNGAVVVNVVTKTTPPATLPQPGEILPYATAPGTPTNSYGFIRFRGVVK